MNETNILVNDIDDIDTIKSEVLKRICELSYSRQLSEQSDNIAYELIPGIRPKFRCCVYREREIIRQRVRLATGKLPTDSHYKLLEPSLMVHVIPSACEGCPIARFTVTDNCQNCLTHKCIKACAFGAISRTPRGSVIDKTLCRNCGKCAQACPYSAIVDIVRPCVKVCPVDAITMDDNDIAKIDKDKCINCGNCVVGCPFGAISDVSMVTNVIDLILDPKKEVYAIIAPAIIGQFGNEYSLGTVKNAISELGFDGVYEVALGADAVASAEAKELLEYMDKGKTLLSSCCPSFFHMVEQYYPELCDNLSLTVPPMVATAEYVKNEHPQAEIVFIGPCISKKADVLSSYIDKISAVLTFEELVAMLRAKKVSLKPESLSDDISSEYGRGFAKSGGVSSAVKQAVAETHGKDKADSIKTYICNGASECLNALKLLKYKRLDVDFIEGMCCNGGCIGGPSVLQDSIRVKRLFDIKDTRTDKINETCITYGLNNLNLHRK